MRPALYYQLCPCRGKLTKHNAAAKVAHGNQSFFATVLLNDFKAGTFQSLDLAIIFSEIKTISIESNFLYGVVYRRWSYIVLHLKAGKED